VKTKRISFDFNEKFTAAELEKIWKDNGLGELDISVFINHATFYPGLNTFEKISEEQVDEMVSVNCYLPVFFSKLAIESFKRHMPPTLGYTLSFCLTVDTTPSSLRENYRSTMPLRFSMNTYATVFRMSSKALMLTAVA